MKKTLALILACCLITGCGPAPEWYEDISDNSEGAYGSSSVTSESSDHESDSDESTHDSSSSSASENPPADSQDSTSSTIESTGDLQSSSSSSSSTSSKPQSSSTSSSSTPSSKPQSSSSSSSASTIANDYGRRAQEPWEVEFADEVFKLINEERAKEGLPALKKMASLTEAATIRAWECLIDYGHERPDGQHFKTALTEQGISFRVCGENIAEGQKTPQEVVNAWMNSPGHRANILSEKYDYEYLGVGFYYDYDGIGGSYRYFWAQNFCGY